MGLQIILISLTRLVGFLAGVFGVNIGAGRGLVGLWAGWLWVGRRGGLPRACLTGLATGFWLVGRVGEVGGLWLVRRVGNAVDIVLVALAWLGGRGAQVFAANLPAW